MNEAVQNAPASVEDIQKDWHELTLRVAQLEAERLLLEQENKSLRGLVERAISYRQKSHTELVMMLTHLVSRLPINDAGVIVSRLVEHNNNVSQMLATLAKGIVDAASLPEPEMLKTLDQSKRELLSALKPVVEDLVKLESPLEPAMLQSLVVKPDLFVSPPVVRANRCYVKGFVPKERILKEFGEEALVFFIDRTTDAKLNPRPKLEEIALEFRGDFEAVFQQHPAYLASKRQELLQLFQRVQKSRANTEAARAQKNAFFRLSFLLELLHFYEHQSTEPHDVVFAHRLPGLVEQLVVTGPQEPLDEKMIQAGEELLHHIINPSHRQMVVNNIGKGGGTGKSLKFVLKLRGERLSEADEEQVIPEFIRHLIPLGQVPEPKRVSALLRLTNPAMQLVMARAILRSDRVAKEQAEALANAVSADLGIKEPLETAKVEQGDPVVMERQRAWAAIKNLISQRNEAVVVAAAIRERLHAKYDADEIKQSWVAITETDPLSLIRIFCQIPYLADGRTDPIARTIIESNVTRLTHEKYAATYKKVVNSLKSLFGARPDHPTLVNFLALVRWVDPEAANRLCADVGITVPV